MKRNLIPAILMLLLCASCDGGGGVHVDTSPIGVGLAAIAAALVLASMVGASFKGGGR